MATSKSKRVFQIVLLAGTAISLYFVPWILVWAWIQPLPDTVQEQVDIGVNYGFEGMIVYVDKKGEPPTTYTAGWHERNQKIPAKPEALFKIASISKLYVAVAITKLAGEGRLDLEQSLTYYFPELQGRIEYADQIPIKYLVQHRSGIPNFTNVHNYWMAPPETNEAKLALILDMPALFEPGTNYDYSNTNYLLLSELIEKIVGYERHQYIQEAILDPLGLKQTYGSLHGVHLDRVMSGYYVGIEADLKTDENGMLATAHDVAVFLRALNEGTIFKGREAEIYKSIYVYDHTGLVPGYQSIAKYHKDIDTVVIQFTNTTDFSGYQWSTSDIIYNRILKILRRD